MYRTILEQLKQWKEKPNRKPLVLAGARQVGKTYILQKFGKTYFSNVAYINCDDNELAKDLFMKDYDMQRIILAIGAITGQRIEAGKTLIVLDEIQEAPRGLSVLKYFCEKVPQYHVAVAGSLLGITMHRGEAFPVGKVDVLSIYPMTFDEFLLAKGKKQMVELLRLKDWDTIRLIRSELIKALREYYFVGGMPEVVATFIATNDAMRVREIQHNILFTYQKDISKHVPVSESNRIQMVWHSMPSQLVKENKKFIYKIVKEGARAREYEDALQWLVDARLVHKIYRSSAPGLPVAAYDDLSAFKIYLVDVGLLRRLAQLAPTAFGEGNRLFTEFKGALTENYVLQTLITQFEVVPRYWTQSNPPYEVDFLIQRENDIFPVEVKSEANTSSKSLKKFKELFPDKVKLRVRFSLDNLKLDDDVLNIPLFMADQADRLIGLALKKQGQQPVS